MQLFITIASAVVLGILVAKNIEAILTFVLTFVLTAMVSIVRAVFYVVALPFRLLVWPLIWLGKHGPNVRAWETISAEEQNERNVCWRASIGLRRRRVALLFSLVCLAYAMVFLWMSEAPWWVCLGVIMVVTVAGARYRLGLTRVLYLRAAR